MDYCADTWYLLTLFDKDLKAKNLLEEMQQGKDWLFVSYAVYAEVVKKLYHRGYSEIEISNFFSLLKSTGKVSFVLIDEKIAGEAAKISLAYSLSLLDAFIAATSKVCGCDFLLSSDSDFKGLQKKKYLKLRSW